MVSAKSTGAGDELATSSRKRRRAARQERQCRDGRNRRVTGVVPVEPPADERPGSPPDGRGLLDAFQNRGG
jgi:hypothetical protein